MSLLEDVIGKHWFDFERYWSEETETHWSEGKPEKCWIEAAGGVVWTDLRTQDYFYCMNWH